MSNCEDSEKKNKLHKQALELTHEKIYIAHQLEETLRKSLKNIKSSIGNLKTVINQQNKPKIEPISYQRFPTKISKQKKKNHIVNNNNPVFIQQIYCTCKKPNGGELIGCDSSKCKVEWFHIECVGLKEVPKGQWFCGDCKKINSV